MKKRSISEKLLLEEISKAARIAKGVSKGLSLGVLIKMIRTQLGMSQQVLSQRSGLRQATISKLESDDGGVHISTLQKVLTALDCDLLMLPILAGSIDGIREMQAQKVAESYLQYLKGTMNLEGQKPDDKFLDSMLEEEKQQLLRDSSSALWKDEQQ